MPSAIEVKKQYGSCSNWRGLLAVSTDLILLALALWITTHYGHHWLVSLAMIGVIGMIQFAMRKSLLHKASYDHLFKTKALNDTVGNVMGYSIFTTLEVWKKEHQIHHKYLLSEQDHLYWDYESYQLHQHVHPFMICIKLKSPLPHKKTGERTSTRTRSQFRTTMPTAYFLIFLIWCFPHFAGETPN